MDAGIDYLFGLGDGHTTTWVSAADADLDGDGRADAVMLDFDGDGRRDDAMWDTDGDGTADVTALDTDDDDLPDTFYRDGGTGVWGQLIADPATLRSTPDIAVAPDDPALDPPPVREPPGDPDPSPDPGRVNLPAPGTEPDESEPDEPDESNGVLRTEDLDGDGRVDVELVGSRRAGIPVAERLYVDEDGDGRFDRVLVDEDGDGRADVSLDDRSPRFGDR